MMKNYDESVEKYHNPNWPYIPDHPYRILTIGGSGSGKTNVLLNLISINDQILIKLFYTSKIHSNEIINCLLSEEKKYELKILKIQKHSLIIHEKLTMFMKIWKTITQQRKGEC